MHEYRQSNSNECIRGCVNIITVVRELSSHKISEDSHQIFIGKMHKNKEIMFKIVGIKK